jgi:hypothetical protein
MKHNHFLQGVELNATQDGEKIKVCAVGSVAGRDGRKYLISGDIAVNTNAAGLKIPLLIEHGYSARGSEAAGWFEDLEAREDGVYARLVKNTLGEELIGGKRYLYLSPALICDRVENTLVAVSIVEISLVSVPNFVLPEVNNQTQQKGEKVETETNKETTAPAAENDEAKLAEAKSLQNSLADLGAKNRALKIDLAVERGQLLPKDKEFALTLNDAQFEAFVSRNAGLMKRLSAATQLEPNASDAVGVKPAELVRYV